MCLLRTFDAVAGLAYARKEIHGTYRGTKGQEAIPVGVCAALKDGDLVFPSLRAVGECLARGTDPPRLMAELFGKSTGVAGGRGGSLHVADASRGLMGAFGVLTANLPLATGSALAAQIGATTAVTACFFGDRATNEDVFHESLNVAALLKLPVLFVAINNAPEDADSSLAEHTAAESMAALAAVHGIPSEIVDGTDVLAVYSRAAAVIQEMRDGRGPWFLECKSFPLDEPSRAQMDGWKAEMRATGQFTSMLMFKKSRIGTVELSPPQRWLEGDPIARLERHLLGESLATPEQLEEIRTDVRAEVEQAATFARQSPEPNPASAATHVFASEASGSTLLGGSQSTDLHPQGELPDSISLGRGKENSPALSGAGARELTFLNAIREALQEEMRRDARVILIGGDVRTSNSGLTAGLVYEFGESRLIDMPTAESAMAGVASGAAMAGLRPVVDLGNLGFATTGFDQFTNEAPKIHYKFNGQITVPVVFLLMYGMRGWGAHHDQSIYALLGHMPGLKLLIPSTPAAARGLLKSAIRDDNPVAFCIAHDLLSSTGPVDDTPVDIGTAAIVRPGQDLSIFTSGAMLARALAAADHLLQRDASIEVVDLRTLVPLDWATLTRSAKTTGRVIVYDQGPFTCGFAATIAAGIQERAWTSLKGPVISLAAGDVPTPYNLTLRDEVVPSTQRLIATIEHMLGSDARPDAALDGRHQHLSR